MKNFFVFLILVSEVGAFGFDQGYFCIAKGFLDSEINITTAEVLIRGYSSLSPQEASENAISQCEKLADQCKIIKCE